jgi:DNA-binding MarR family transcriptional regulator
MLICYGDKMSGKKPPTDLNLKRLGSLQEKTLFFIAENPENNAQAIQKELGYPSPQYPNILKAVKTLEKMGFVKSRKSKSMKKVPIKLYSCTETGVFYALSKNPRADMKKILENYKDQYEIYKPFYALSEKWGQEGLSRFFKNAGEFFLIMQKDGREKAIAFLLMRFQMESKDEAPEVRKKMVRETMEQFPNAKKTMEELREILNELLGGENSGSN